MDIRISGHQLDTGAALQEHATKRLNGIVGKYFSRALSSTVTFGKAPAGAFRCDIVTHAGNGLVLKGAAIAGDAHIALDQASDKIDRQLRRYKRRLYDRHSQSAHANKLDAHANKLDEAAYTVFEEPQGEEEITVDFPVVIAETRVDVPEATVSDAVMMLDLRNTNALLFKNAGTGKHNMVYRRGDGSIGWVEPG